MNQSVFVQFNQPVQINFDQQQQHHHHHHEHISYAAKASRVQTILSLDLERRDIPIRT
jgi:hypothetical protein